MSKLGQFYRDVARNDDLKAALGNVISRTREAHIAALIAVARDFGVSLDRADFDLPLGKDAKCAMARGWSRRTF